MTNPHRREEPVPEIGLGREAGANRRARTAEEVELGAVRVCRMDHGGVFPETTRIREELDRSEAMLGEALLDLAWLLVCVDVKWKPLLRRVAAELEKPVARAGANRVGGDASGDPALA